MIDSTLTAIADGQPSISHSQLLPRHNFEKMKKETALLKILDNDISIQSLAG